MNITNNLKVNLYSDTRFANKTGESYVPKPQYSLPEPSRSVRQTKGILSDSRNMAATLPVRFEEPRFHGKSVESTDSFLQMGKSWTPVDHESAFSTPGGISDSVRSQDLRESLATQDGGWNIPDDTESVTDWNRGQSGGRRGPPRAY
ncbi:hypothetical protein ScPMuIL_007594 [Solemya velum]